MKESQTEELIINTAKYLIFYKGNFHATTQDIADAAGVNRALIHYYFRSREHLMDEVLKAGMVKMEDRIIKITQSDLSFREKIKNFISVIIDEAIQTPYLENFVVNEHNRIGMPCDNFNKTDYIEKSFANFFDQIKDEMNKGTIPTLDPIHFIINLVSLCIYPISTRPLLQQTFSLDDEAYNIFIDNQKETIYKLIFRD